MEHRLLDIKSYDFSLLKKYNFVNNNRINSFYFQLSFFYKMGVELFLKSSLNLQDYDNELQHILKDYKIEKKIDFLSFSYSHIFIRNNTHIERLNEKNMSILIKKFYEKNADQEFFELIKTTYKQVLSYQNETFNSNFFHYEETSDNCFIKNDCLLLIIKYDLSDSEFHLTLENYRIIQQKIFDIKNKIIENSKNKKIKVEVGFDYVV